MAGGNAAAPNVKTIMSSARNPKALIKGTYVTAKNQIRSFTGRTMRSVNKMFKKDTWKGLYKKLTTIGKKEGPADPKLTMDRPQGHHPAAHKGKTPETYGKGRDEKMEEAVAPKSKEAANKKQQESVQTEKDPEIDELKKHEGNVDESSKKKMKEEADEDIPDGPNADSKRKALLAAKIIIEANDKIDTPIPILLTELKPLTAFKGVKGFVAEGGANGKFDIFMLGSKHFGGKVDLKDSKNNESEKNDDIEGQKKEKNKNIEGRGAAKKEDFYPREEGAQVQEYIDGYANDITNAEEWVGKGAWPHKPIMVVEVDGKKVILDGHHRIEAAKKVNFSGEIPFKQIPVEDSGYTLQQLRQYIK